MSQRKRSLSSLALPAQVSPAIALVMLAATGTACAQTPGSQVTMYGIADIGLMSTDRGGNTRNTIQVMSGVSSTSRWGLRGSEDLGGGLKAIFNVEAQLNVDDGTGAATGGGLNFARRSFVGLEGGFGQVYLGRDYTPGYYVAIGNDTFRYGLWGSTITFSSGSGGLTTRASNAIFYKSPSMGGLEVRAMYGFGERDTAPQRGGDIAGAAIYWTGGPANVAAYYHALKVTTGNTAPTTRQYGIGGGWNAGAFRLNAGYGASDPAGASNTLSHAYLGAGVKLGAGELLAQVMQQRREAAGGDQKAITYALAYTHPLSRRTNLYLTAGVTRNNSAGSFGINNSANALTPAVAGADPRAVGLGLRHTF